MLQIHATKLLFVTEYAEAQKRYDANEERFKSDANRKIAGFSTSEKIVFSKKYTKGQLAFFRGKLDTIT